MLIKWSRETAAQMARAQNVSIHPFNCLAIPYGPTVMCDNSLGDGGVKRQGHQINCIGDRLPLSLALGSVQSVDRASFVSTSRISSAP